MKKMSFLKYIVRFEPPFFVYNARDYIIDEIKNAQHMYKFLVFSNPLDEGVG